MDYSNQINIGGVNIAVGDSSGAKKALPPGTKRETFKNFEEVSVPAVNPGALLPEEQLVDIAALEPWARTAFKGYKTLNRIQSRIFQVRLAPAAATAHRRVLTIPVHCLALPCVSMSP